MNILYNFISFLGDFLKKGGGSITGSLIPYAGNDLPEGFLLCDGSAVSRDTYKKLFNVIGTTYGEGDGELTFNLPDFRNRVIWGSDTSGTVKAAGLPNITGDLSAWGMGQNNVGDLGYYVGNPLWNGSIGKFSDNADARRKGIGASNESNRCLIAGFKLDASKSNSIYGNSNTVQPPAITIKILIKY